MRIIYHITYFNVIVLILSFLLRQYDNVKKKTFNVQTHFSGAYRFTECHGYWRLFGSMPNLTFGVTSASVNNIDDGEQLNQEELVYI